MDPFYSFLIFALVLALDLLAGQFWWKWYYRFGLPVLVSRREWAAAAPSALAAPALAESLTPTFHGRPEHPSIRFKPLSERLVAFREVLFENRGGGRYLPVMHYTLRLHPDERSLSVTGYLNGYVMVALAYLVYRAWAEPSFLPVAALILIILSLSFIAQVSVSRRVLDAAAAAGRSATSITTEQSSKQSTE